MLRAYYGKSIADFIQEDNQKILGELSEKHQNNKLEILQKNAWKQQITI